MKNLSLFIVGLCLFYSAASRASTRLDRDEANCATQLNQTQEVAAFDSGSGDVLRDFAAAAYIDGAQNRASIGLETSTDIYFYSESCDIGADLYKCSRRDSKIENILSAHQITCDDLPKLDRSEIQYTSCK
jgi:hypothetical protein